jgi:hypothetical protein
MGQQYQPKTKMANRVLTFKEGDDNIGTHREDFLNDG